MHDHGISIEEMYDNVKGGAGRSFSFTTNLTMVRRAHRPCSLPHNRFSLPLRRHRNHSIIAVSASAHRGCPCWISTALIDPPRPQAALIAGTGIAVNSSVSVVASMLISPLMGPILGIAFGFVARPPRDAGP
jgi:hypothetical protein